MAPPRAPAPGLPGYSDRNITKFSIEQLQKLLRDEDINFEDDAERHTLQALWTLQRLGHIERREELSDDLERFWGLTVKEQVAELERDDLSTKGTKWEHVKTFVEAEIAELFESEDSLDDDGPPPWKKVKTQKKPESKEKVKSKRTKTTLATVTDEDEDNSDEYIPTPSKKTNAREKPKAKKTKTAATIETDEAGSVGAVTLAPKNTMTPKSKKTKIIPATQVDEDSSDGYVAPPPKKTMTKEKQKSKKKPESGKNPERGKESGSEKKSESKETTKADSSASSQTALPHPAVVNLLITIIFTDAAINRPSISLSSCPVSLKRSVKRQLNSIPAFETAEDLQQALDSHASKRLLRWICDTYGTRFEVVSDDQKIPGLSDNIPQFTVHNHPGHRQEAFNWSFEEKGSRSMLLFHGTPTVNILSIHATGFKIGNHKGVYTAERPTTSYPYADGVTSKYDGPPRPEQQWANTPYRNFGALFGCEVTGNGQLKRDNEGDPGKIHVIRDPKRVLERYLFLIAEADMLQTLNASTPRPLRTEVEKPMLAGFERLRGKANPAK